MSWLNFNDSLNNLKGQITTFANNVLTVEREDSDLSEEFTTRRTEPRVEQQDLPHKSTSNVEDDNNWGWNIPIHDTDSNRSETIISDLIVRVKQLETDKKDLEIGLEQLNKELQDSTDRLITLKQSYQGEYNALKDDYDSLKKEFGTVLAENSTLRQNKIDDKQYENLRAENEELKKRLLDINCQSESNNLIEELEKLKITLSTLEEENLRLKEEGFEKIKFDNGQSVSTNENFSPIEFLQIENESKLDGENEESEENLIQDTINQLRSENALLESKLKNILAENENLKLLTVDLTDKTSIVDQYESDNRVLKNEIGTIKKDFEEISNKLYSSEEKFRNLLLEIKKLEEENQVLQVQASSFEELQAENETLKNEISKLKLLEAEKLNYITENQILNDNISELKKECAQLKSKNLHEKYVNIITESIKKFIENSQSDEISLPNEDPLISEFSEKVETLLKLLLEFRSKSENLEKELCDLSCEKTRLVSEKNFEIEKLLKNSEILSQEVILKTQTIKDYEEECSELMKNNDMLLTELQNYKNTSGLQTISESNEDNLLLLESQLETAIKRIQELEGEVQCSSFETETELQYIKKQLNLTGQELNQSKEEYHSLVDKLKMVENERNDWKSNFERLVNENENTEYKLEETNAALETYKEEVDDYKKRIENLDSNYRNTIEKFENTIEDLNVKLRQEIETTAKKDDQIRTLVEKLQNSKMCETTLKLQVDTINKERQVALESKNAMELQLERCNKTASTMESDKCEIERLNEKISSLEAQLHELNTSRTELINLVQIKHQESIQYHSEIQRLSQVILEETGKTRQLQQQLETTQNSGDELEKLVDQNNFLREKCEVLATNLMEEQANCQKIVLERNAAVEKAEKKLERLQVHLVEQEENYTQELLVAEKQNKSLLAKLSELEQREKDSSSIYTSVNIRANQQLETLQAQLQLVTNQRDELRTKLSEAEDEQSRQAGALNTLQFVLEQFQKDKENAIHEETERIRKQITVEKEMQNRLRVEIDNLKAQLQESKQGLQAALRLGEQLEKGQQQVADMKTEVSKLRDQLQKSEAKRQELLTSTDSKVDKSLVKNLVIGLLTANSTYLTKDQNQILKIIATVLDFNQRESEKVHLNKSTNDSWLNALLHPGSGGDSTVNQQSLSEAFVRFLENESKPLVLPHLPTHVKEPEKGESVSNPGQSPLVLNEIVLPTFTDFGRSRSSGSILKDVLKDNS